MGVQRAPVATEGRQPQPLLQKQAWGMEWMDLHLDHLPHHCSLGLFAHGLDGDHVPTALWWGYWASESPDAEPDTKGAMGHAPSAPHSCFCHDGLLESDLCLLNHVGPSPRTAVAQWCWHIREYLISEEFTFGGIGWELCFRTFSSKGPEITIGSSDF